MTIRGHRATLTAAVAAFQEVADLLHYVQSHDLDKAVTALINAQRSLAAVEEAMRKWHWGEGTAEGVAGEADRLGGNGASPKIAEARD